MRGRWTTTIGWALAWALLASTLVGCTAMRPAVVCGPPAGPPVPWQALAPGVWVWAGDPGEIGADNGGRVAPVSLVVDGGEAAVIDPGPSRLVGKRVRESVACRFRARVRWVVNTHAHAENVLGNSAWADLDAVARPPVVSGAATQTAMRNRCPACLASLTARVGGAAMAGTGIVLPDRVLQAGDVLPVGRMRLVVQPFERGHSEGDLVLWNPAHRVVWAGGLVYSRRVPELAQGRLDDWLVALDHLEALAPAHVVSAAVSSRERAGDLPEALGETRAYLMALRQGVLQAMDEGHQPQEAGLVPLPAFSSWAGYAQRHAFNVQRAWRELEPVWMDRAP